MNIAEIKGRLTNMPHVKTIWVKAGEFYISPVFGGQRVELKDMDNETASPIVATEESELPTLKKQSKKKKDGTK